MPAQPYLVCPRIAESYRCSPAAAAYRMADFPARHGTRTDIYAACAAENCP